MAHFHVKKKKGRPYLYVREIARVDGKPKVVSQVYLGSPERVAGLAKGIEKEPIKIKVEEFGALWLAQQMDLDIKLAAIIDGIVPRETGPSIGDYFLYCVWNRMIEAVSKNRLSLWFKNLQKFRASIEGIISGLMRGFGLKRCIWKGWESFLTYVSICVFTFNSRKIALLLR